MRGGGGGGISSCGGGGGGGIVNVGGEFCCCASFNPCLFLLCLNMTYFLLNSLSQSGHILSVLSHVLLLLN